MMCQKMNLVREEEKNNNFFQSKQVSANSHVPNSEMKTFLKI